MAQALVGRMWLSDRRPAALRPEAGSRPCSPSRRGSTRGRGRSSGHGLRRLRSRRRAAHPGRRRGSPKLSPRRPLSAPPQCCSTEISSIVRALSCAPAAPPPNRAAASPVATRVTAIGLYTSSSLELAVVSQSTLSRRLEPYIGSPGVLRSPDRVIFRQAARSPIRRCRRFSAELRLPQKRLPSPRLSGPQSSRLAGYPRPAIVPA